MKTVAIGLLAHVDAGKTTLSESLLYTSGRIKNLGRVDNKDAYLDTYEIEKERGITVFSKQAIIQDDDMYLTLMDTPGHVDFSAEMERTLQVLDYGILLVSGVDGVQGHTLTLWRLLERYDIPVFVFVNKMDQPGTSRSALLCELQEHLDSGIIDFTDPYSDETTEQIALCDESLLDKYLSGDTISCEDMVPLIAQRKIYPCFFGSALKMEGISDFYDALRTYTMETFYGADFGARVYKILKDDKGDRLTYVKVTGGTLRARMPVDMPDDHRQEKINQIRIYSGEKYETVTEARPGMICALTGLTQTYPGQGLGWEADAIEPSLQPVLSYQVVLPDSCDVATMLPKLRELEQEEPMLHVLWDESHGEICVQVMGDVQLEILKRLIYDRYGVDVSFGVGSIVYKETIARAVEGVGHFEPLRHYAEVHLWIEPGEAGSGVTVDTKCSEDVLDRGYQHLVLHHLTERDHPGVLTGSSITDVKITLIAGRAHLKHTEGGDFRQATYRALRQGLMQTESVLLEPYYTYRLQVPHASVGRAIADLERMHADFNMDETSGVLTGEGPVSTMREYPREVAAYTKGMGHISLSYAGYRPCHDADAVIQAKRYDPENDVDYPTGSIFCSHGSGFYVPWDRVCDYMHIDTGSDRQGDTEDTPDLVISREEEEYTDVEEIDRILHRATHANERDNQKKRRIKHQNKPVGLSKPRKKKEIKGTYLLVDGYNIIHAWRELSDLAQTDIASARDRLMDILCDYQGYKQWEVILVFDAYRVANHPTESVDYHNIHLVYTKEAETADQYIERFAHVHASQYHVIVATSDGLEQIIIRGAGCKLMSARDLEADVSRTREEIRGYLDGDAGQ